VGVTAVEVVGVTAVEVVVCCSDVCEATVSATVADDTELETSAAEQPAATAEIDIQAKMRIDSRPINNIVFHFRRRPMTHQ
jgi:hypothetical protein